MVRIRIKIELVAMVKVATPEEAMNLSPRPYRLSPTYKSARKNRSVPKESLLRTDKSNRAFGFQFGPKPT